VRVAKERCVCKHNFGEDATFELAEAVCYGSSPLAYTSPSGLLYRRWLVFRV
jgi:hypothetical protein